MAARQLLRWAGPQPEDKRLHCARRVSSKRFCVQLLLHGADPHKRDGADHDAYDYAGDESSRFAVLVEEARLQRKAAGDDGTAAGDDDTVAGGDDTVAGGDDTAGDGESSAQATAVVEGDTHSDVERAQESVLEGGSSSSRPRKRGRERDEVDSTAKRRV